MLYNIQSSQYPAELDGKNGNLKVRNISKSTYIAFIALPNHV